MSYIGIGQMIELLTYLVWRFLASQFSMLRLYSC